MRKNFAHALQIFRPYSILTGGFTLISVGAATIYGAGFGLVTAGVLAVALDWHTKRDG